jgi:hypothetical protein
MKLHEEFKLYENMWDEPKTDALQEGAGIYKYECIYCGKPAHLNGPYGNYTKGDPENARVTPVGLVHETCWDDWADPDETGAYNYYGFAEGNFNLTKAERLQAENAWNTCRKSGKLFMTDPECDEIEKKFVLKVKNMANRGKKRTIFFDVWSDEHIPEVTNFFTEDEAEARDKFRERVTSFYESGPDDYCRYSLYSAEVTSAQINVLKAVISNGRQTLTKPEREIYDDLVETFATCLDEAIGGQDYDYN